MTKSNVIEFAALRQVNFYATGEGTLIGDGCSPETAMSWDDYLKIIQPHHVVKVTDAEIESLGNCLVGSLTLRHCCVTGEAGRLIWEEIKGNAIIFRHYVANAPSLARLPSLISPSEGN